MPVLGNLAEFPLPEVLHFIGARTGRMRMIDVPGADLMELDVHAGYLYGFHSGGVSIDTADQVIQRLSGVLQAERGMFEFNLTAEKMIRGTLQLPLQSLAMELAYNVDQMNHESQRLMSPQSRFILLQEPQVWLEYELRQFFHFAKEMIRNQASLAEIADYLGIEPRLTVSHLSKLRMLGFIDLAPEPRLADIPVRRTARVQLPPIIAVQNNSVLKVG